jgi:23S rRNA (cytidine1920-2'-O)/16S rRNA (cytidine1409-2'-O)-methyltransferase
MFQKGLAESRQKAKALVMTGHVQVNGMRVDKPGRLVPLSASIKINRNTLPYVSRGGLKLEAALEHFNVDVEGKTLLDVGASTGGFTDCLLQRGAGRIFAIDVGYGQLDWKLRQDDRVEVLEKTNIRHLKREDMEAPVDGAVIDVAFISLRLVIPPVSELLKRHAFIIALLKPQFEVKKEQVGKGGVIRDPLLHHQIVERLCIRFENLKWTVVGHIPSPILGPKGNREFLIYLTR